MTNSEWSMRLFGSAARGGSDEFSDVDLLVVGDVPKRHVIEQVRAGARAAPVAIAQYSWEQVKQMAEYGSLFLQHVLLEGQRVASSSDGDNCLDDILSSMGDYTRTEADLLAFHTVVDDSVMAVSSGHEPSYEAGVVATTIRHSSILGCWLLGEPSFGRIEPTARIFDQMGYGDELVRDYEKLYSCKLYSEGRLSSIDMPSATYVLRWCETAREIGDFVRNV